MRILLLLALFSCPTLRAADMPGEHADYLSPSGRVIARVGIAGPEASPSTRFRIRLVFETATKQRIGEIWTGLRHHWAVRWTAGDAFLVCGVNEETEGCPLEFYVYDFSEKGKGGYRRPTEEERKEVLQEYLRKYGAEPSQPKAPEPTPSAGTSAAEQPLAPAAFLAHL